MKRQYKNMILFLLIPILGFSVENDFNYSKQKSINKTYIVNPDATVVVNNSYGSITVTTWNEDIIELDIIIKVSGNNEKWVNQRLDDIDVDINALKAIISATTILGNSGYQNQGRNNSFEINYILKIPKNGSVQLSNKYGNIITTDLYGNVDIKCKYGKVTLGKLWNSSSIQMDYCSNSVIAFIKTGIINAKYSNLKIIEIDKLDLISDYTDVEIIESDFLKYNSKYGKINIKNIKTLDASGNYLTIRLGEIFNSLKLNTKYSSLKIDSINTRANKVAITSEYTGITIGFDPNFAFDFNISLKCANFKFDNELDFYSKEEVSNSKKYNGFYKKKGLNNLTIVSDYGNVTLTKNH
jgi:hypothetical protein